ncbi:hypothetical protein SAMN05192583_1414 [Sphingomonas gellani]|uniref:Uncharacterized protein n=1 Tax=Sphingomonas gellani TaxID=1166340 RepID=A0A1H8C1D3_9SPHN|nr:hypothetical protein [Sphingomonas gellani]SEM88880.1 hypothetical protein SAMN05192583_1414 [Sphingomonas gellani]
MTSLPPRLADYRFRGYCADTAAHLLRGREASFPAYVEAGKLTAEAAGEGLALIRALAAQWRWITDLAAPACPAWNDRTGYFGRYNHLLVAELATIAVKARAQADRNPTSDDRRIMADLCDALAWHQRPYSGLSGEAVIVVMVSAERVVDLRRKRAERLAA